MFLAYSENRSIQTSSFRQLCLKISVFMPSHSYFHICSHLRQLLFHFYLDFVLCNAPCKPTCFVGSTHEVYVVVNVFLFLHAIYMNVISFSQSGILHVLPCLPRRSLSVRWRCMPDESHTRAKAAGCCSGAVCNADRAEGSIQSCIRC